MEAGHQTLTEGNISNHKIESIVPEENSQKNSEPTRNHHCEATICERSSAI